MQLKRLFLTTGKGLPLKTRIAVWFIFITTSLWVAWFLIGWGAIAGFEVSGDIDTFGFLLLILIHLGPYPLAAYLLTRKSKRACIAAVSILILLLLDVNWRYPITAETLYRYTGFIFNFIILLPITLVMLDVRNYWKIAR
ncbi:MAG: hypothetical protein IBX68_06255 [Dehalococcoidia bacterium]|nr:hypothetical protein [Dehalococcoidia bacterium]